MLSLFPLDGLGEIWDIIESVSAGFRTYSFLSQEFIEHKCVFSDESNINGMLKSKGK